MQYSQRFFASAKFTVITVCRKIILKLTSSSDENASSAYDLCPTDKAEYVECYIERLDHLLTKRAAVVREIAVTAPYSGGKSSFINTYMKIRRKNKYTRISLADFNDGDSGEKKVETGSDDREKLNKIEEAIVQQILYRPSREKTPYSRFRRIVTPVSYWKAWHHSVGYMMALISMFALAKMPVFSIQNLFESNAVDTTMQYNHLISFICMAYVVAFGSLVLKDGIRYLSRQRVTSISPAKGLITFDESQKDSVFNVHLEEIIYYFKCTESNIVIVEDLDRFQRTDIFVELKRLNNLINESGDVKQDVVFIYALRDDVFKGPDRTKFFDAIIPVVPVLSKFNVYPQFKKWLANVDLASDFDDMFLKDVSVFIEDMRILKNIVSEYKIYRDVLNKNFAEFSRNKLMAFVIYKNVHSGDFACLHGGAGWLAKTIKDIDRMRFELSSRIAEKIQELTSEIEKYNKEIASSSEELNLLYLYRFFREKGGPLPWGINNESVLKFAEIGKLSDITVSSSNSTIKGAANQNIGSFRNNELDRFLKDNSHTERLRLLNDGYKKVIIEGKSKLEKLVEEHGLVKSYSIRKILGTDEAADLYEQIKAAIPLLAHFLRRGYIGEDYGLYMSHFHEGDMTRRDMEFVVAVKKQQAISCDYSIDNCEETFGWFNEEDYRTEAFFNIKIFEYLLTRNIDQPLKVHVSYCLKSHVERAEKLSRSRFLGSSWFALLADVWPEFISCFCDDQNLSFVIKNEFLIAALSSLNVDEKCFVDSRISFANYIKSELSLIDAIEKSDNVKKFVMLLSKLNVSFGDIEGIKGCEKFMRQAIPFGLILPSIVNLKYLIEVYAGRSVDPPFDYLNLKEIDDPHFVDFIEDNLESLAGHVVAGYIHLSSEEDLLLFINDDQLDHSVQQKIIAKSEVKIIDIESSVEKNWNLLVQHKAVLPSWNNLLVIIGSKSIEKEIVANYLNSVDVIRSLCEEKCERFDDDINLVIERMADRDIDSETLIKFLNVVNWMFPSDLMEVTDIDKIRDLITCGKIEPTLANHEVVFGVDPQVAAFLVEMNYGDYCSDSVRLSAVKMDINGLLNIVESEVLSRDQKVRIAESKLDLLFEDLSVFSGKELKDLMVRIDGEKSRTFVKIDASKLMDLLNSDYFDRDQKLHLIISNFDRIGSEEEIRKTIVSLGGKYADLTKPSGRVIMDDTKVNRDLLETLKNRSLLVSSYKPDTSMFGNAMLKINLKRAD